MEEIALYVAFVTAGSLYSRILVLSEAEIAKRIKIVIHLFVPVLIFGSSLSLVVVADKAVMMLVIASATFAISILMSVFTHAVFGNFAMKSNIIIASSLMNCGYVGIPVAAMFGDAVGKQAIYFAVMYTPFIIITTKYVDSSECVNAKNIIRQMLFDASIVAMVAGAVCGFVGIPNVFESAVTKISAVTPVVMLFAMGMLLGGMRFEWSNIVASFILVACRIAAAVASIASIMIFYKELPEDIMVASIIQSAMPIGVLPYFLLKDAERKQSLGLAVLISTIIFGVLLFLWQTFFGGRT